MRLFRLALCFCFLQLSAFAATYYVDYEGGKDSNTGTAMDSPLKHCPGDSSVEGVAREIQLKAGDTVIFKGGVAYKGAVTLSVKGTQGKPVIIDGNTEGKFGSGRAIIEGGETVTGWKKCANAEEAEGNPQWQEIWYTDDIPDNADPYGVNLCQGDLMFHVAVHPCSENLAIWSDVETAIKPAEAPNTENPAEHSLSDPYFKQASPETWNGAFIGLRAGANAFFMTPVTRFDPAANRIYFKTIKAGFYSDLSKHRFVMLNALEVLTRPGQYVLAPKSRGTGKRLYCWPVEGNNFPAETTISCRPVGIVISASKHLMIRGFLIQNQTDSRATGIRCIDAGTEYLTLENNWLRHQKATMDKRVACIGVTGCKNLVIRKNQLSDILGIGLLLSKDLNVLVEDNVFNSILDTTVDFYGCKDVRCLRNRVSGLAGLHANGLTFYLGNENVLIEGNVVAHENPLTFSELNGIRVINNVFDGIGRANGISIWAGKPAHNVVIEHNTIVNATRNPARNYCAGIYLANKEGTNWVFRNNIIDGVSGDVSQRNEQMTHNLFLRLIPKYYGKEIGSNAVVELEAAEVFVAPANGDYRLKPGSPAIGAGIAGEVKVDINGKARNGEKPDIGAYGFEMENR